MGLISTESSQSSSSESEPEPELSSSDGQQPTSEPEVPKPKPKHRGHPKSLTLSRREFTKSTGALYNLEVVYIMWKTISKTKRFKSSHSRKPRV